MVNASLSVGEAAPSLPVEVARLLPAPVTDVKQISSKPKSVVLDVQCGARRFVVKNSLFAALRCEYDVYSEVLPSLGVPAPTVRGWVESDGGVWLVTDYVLGRRPALEDPEDRACVSRWVARLHALSRRAPMPALPTGRARTSPERRLEDVRQSILDRRASGVLESSRASRSLDAWARIADALPAVHRAAAGLPDCLAHGDLLTDWNLLITEDRVVIGVDWERAGWGSPAIDMGIVDGEAYRCELLALGQACSRDEIRLGRLAGLVLGALAHDLPRKPWEAQQKYLARILRALEGLTGMAVGHP